MQQIFGIPEQDVPEALAARVGPVFAEEALQAAGGAAWSSLAGMPGLLGQIDAPLSPDANATSPSSPRWPPRD